MFVSSPPMSKEEVEKLKSECKFIYIDALNKYSKLLPYLMRINDCFSKSDNRFLTFSDSNDLDLYNIELKELSDVCQRISERLGIE